MVLFIKHDISIFHITPLSVQSESDLLPVSPLSLFQFELTCGFVFGQVFHVQYIDIRQLNEKNYRAVFSILDCGKMG